MIRRNLIPIAVLYCIQYRIDNLLKAAADQGHHDAALHRGIGNIHGFTDPKDITPGSQFLRAAVAAFLL